jgi:hypothetical protein
MTIETRRIGSKAFEARTYSCDQERQIAARGNTETQARKAVADAALLVATTEPRSLLTADGEVIVVVRLEDGWEARTMIKATAHPHSWSAYDPELPRLYQDVAHHVAARSTTLSGVCAHAKADGALEARCPGACCNAIDARRCAELAASAPVTVNA